MVNPRLHLDADASYRSLQKALTAKGHDVTRAPTEWVLLNAGDRRQLLEATQGVRCILTFNSDDFIRLSKEYPAHGGIILAYQREWTLTGLIVALDRLLSETPAEGWPGHYQPSCRGLALSKISCRAAHWHKS